MQHAHSGQNLPIAFPQVLEFHKLASYTTLRIGGRCRWFAEPSSEDFVPILKFAGQEGIPVIILGNGSNVLLPDDDLNALVIHTGSSGAKISLQDDLLVADCGVPLPRLAREAARMGVAGFEFLIGIPGTVGGGVAMNAGLTSKLQRSISDVIERAEVLTPSGNVVSMCADELALRYRGSRILDEGLFVIRASFRIEERATTDAIMKIAREHLLERKLKQPLTKPTAGSTFKQPESGKPAGWYIDNAGLKGFEIGGVQISKKHANWIENTGCGTSRDVKSLILHVQERVKSEFGILLEREIRYLPDDICKPEKL